MAGELGDARFESCHPALAQDFERRGYHRLWNIRPQARLQREQSLLRELGERSDGGSLFGRITLAQVSDQQGHGRRVADEPQRSACGGANESVAIL
jgi:hypothetical protein